MKFISLTTLIVAFSLITNAQAKKPTKEETVKYLNTLCQAGLGMAKGKDFIINSVVLTYTSLEVKTTPNISVSTWSNIPWQEFISIEVLSPGKLLVIFKTAMPFQMHQPATGTSQAYSNDEPEKSIHLYAPVDKIESAKKAVMRLVEIAKDENKDPF
jgi:hypothetical protein